MRIIAGEFRSRRLSAVGQTGRKAVSLRPTTDRVREAIFSHITSGIYDDPITKARVLDIFAGTGAMGFEALSRGGAYVDFVDNSKESLRLIAKNSQSLDVQKKCQLHKIDATTAPPLPAHPASLVFLDPPYKKNIAQQALPLFSKKGWISKNALIIWEDGEKITPPTGFCLLNQRRYAKSWVHILQLCQ